MKVKKMRILCDCEYEGEEDENIVSVNMKLKKMRIRSKCDVPQGQVSEQVVVEEQQVVKITPIAIKRVRVIRRKLVGERSNNQRLD